MARASRRSITRLLARNRSALIIWEQIRQARNGGPGNQPDRGPSTRSRQPELRLTMRTTRKANAARPPDPETNLQSTNQKSTKHKTK